MIAVKYHKMDKVMKRVPFSVSARAARLIGRENVATSQGAITELVKNSYDADATACVLLFVRRFQELPSTLAKSEYQELRPLFPKLAELYEEKETDFQIKPEHSDALALDFNNLLNDVLDLWIVDNGSGMSEKTIEERWMVIGTDAKERDPKSSNGRALTGAKGIGRFALDRLGRECELLSAAKDSNELVRWLVDWGDFEGSGKIITQVTAALQTEKGSLSHAMETNELSKVLPKTRPTNFEDVNELNFSNGTAIKISSLHDKWDVRDSLKLKETLEALLPPKDQGDFGIYVFDHRSLDQSGWIENFPPDQFDFRTTFTVGEEGSVSVVIDRQEIDVPNIRPSVFEFPSMQEPGYTKSDFKKGSIEYSTSLDEIVALEDWEDTKDLLSIGPFSFTLYYFKLANPTKTNLERFPQKTFDVSKRKKWLENSGGIRLYRDEFRVRPYGEPNTQGSDWLLLGQRVAQNPSAVSRLSWRVPPQQVAGTIHISKEGNPLLADQSNREGIMNERSFSLFRRIILALIKEFERDRSYIYHHFDLAYEKDNPSEGTLSAGKKIAKEVLKKQEKKDANSKAKDPQQSFTLGDDSEEPEDKADSNSLPLAQALKISEAKNEELQDEIQVLRGMATLGTVLVSFTHELKQIKANMGSRQARMKNALDRIADPVKLETLPNKMLDPYDLLSRWGREDDKVGRWVNFALSSVSPSKRRRHAIAWEDYFCELKSYWSDFLDSRKVTFDIPNQLDKDTLVLAHEIDLDSVFYNLIVNSLEAFNLPSPPIDRKIGISLEVNSNNDAVIRYEDNGPGVAKVFNTIDDIFIFGSTSKREAKANEVSGTGIGMWLMKSIVDDYGGQVSMKSKMGQPNFEIEIRLPIYERAPKL